MVDTIYRLYFLSVPDTITINRRGERSEISTSCELADSDHVIGRNLGGQMCLCHDMSESRREHSYSLAYI